jgi:nucleotide-binding universal stress UspA family protein
MAEIERSAAMFETATKYGILTAVDGSAESRAAVAWAAREATLRNEPVTLMNVIQPVVSWPIGATQGTIAKGQEDTARRARAGTQRPDRRHESIAAA